MTPEAKTRMLVGTSILAVLATFLFIGPIEQPPDYHDFADRNAHFGIPNFGNVVSNIVFLIAGLMGLALVQGSLSDQQRFLDPREALPFYLVFLGSVLVTFGSGFYHLNPGNMTLVVDRLTMTVAFVGVLGFIIAERISVKWGLKLLPVFLTLGLFSVVYWIHTEMQAAGDLRLYVLVQFLPLVAIPVMLLAFPARYSATRFIWWSLVAYAVAKLFEQFDEAIWDMTQHLVSGHSLKHLVTGLGIYFLVLYVQRRRALP